MTRNLLSNLDGGADGKVQEAPHHEHTEIGAEHLPSDPPTVVGRGQLLLDAMMGSTAGVAYG